MTIPESRQSMLLLEWKQESRLVVSCESLRSFIAPGSIDSDLRGANIGESEVQLVVFEVCCFDVVEVDILLNDAIYEFVMYNWSSCLRKLILFLSLLLSKYIYTIVSFQYLDWRISRSYEASWKCVMLLLLELYVFLFFWLNHWTQFYHWSFELGKELVLIARQMFILRMWM